MCTVQWIVTNVIYLCNCHLSQNTEHFYHPNQYIEHSSPKRFPHALFQSPSILFQLLGMVENQNCSHCKLVAILCSNQNAMRWGTEIGKSIPKNFTLLYMKML